MTGPYVIVVGTDYSEQAAHALRIAFEHAVSHAPSELHVAHASLAVSTDVAASEPLPIHAASPFMSREEQRATLLQHIGEELSRSPAFPCVNVRVQAHVLLDAPGFALTSLADELDAKLLVVASHGRRGLARLLLGSVAEAVVRQATCPVLVVPPPGRAERQANYAPTTSCSNRSDATAPPTSRAR